MKGLKALKALIASNEIVYDYDGSVLGQRVVQVEHDYNIFGVSSPLSWVDCGDDVVADRWYFDPKDNEIKIIPVLSANT